MTARKDPPVTANPWGALRRFTTARIALGRAGGSLPTGHHLAFQLAHARARDAVHHPLDVGRLAPELLGRGWSVITAHSAAPDRATYLQRPDLGRCLDEASRARFVAWQRSHEAAWDLVIVVADGLSALAIEHNALPLLDALRPSLLASGWALAPLVVVQQARVAIGDEIAQALGARMVAVLIGERPGLSAPDSLGIYLTWQPGPDTTDAGRNCISNVRREGQSPAAAARTLMSLMRAAATRQITGVTLKDERDAPDRRQVGGGNFLLDE
jgi:ethanolamine ammonia-lyase small subunit